MTATLPAGQKIEAAVPLTAGALAVVAKAKKLPATARVSAWATGGSGSTLPITVTLTPPKPAKKPPAKKH
jgi:hypothetical protein